MFTVKVDPFTTAARKFNGAVDDAILLAEKMHPEHKMLAIARRKINFIKSGDILLPVDLAWKNKLLTVEMGKNILSKNPAYFTKGGSVPYDFAAGRKDLNKEELMQIVYMFDDDWFSGKISDEDKEKIWGYARRMYEAYVEYGTACLHFSCRRM